MSDGENISLTRLQDPLSAKANLECFLRLLLGNAIELKWEPELVLPWCSIHTSDIRATGTERTEYLVFIGSCRFPPSTPTSDETEDTEDEHYRLTQLVQELQAAALDTGNEFRKMQLIMICDVPLRQSYYLFAPAAVNVGQEHPLQIEGVVSYHLLTTFADAAPTAPPEIQQLLKALRGEEAKSVDSPSPLVNMLQSAQEPYTWLTPLRFYRKRKCAETIQTALEDGCQLIDAIVLGAREEDSFVQGYTALYLDVVASELKQAGDDFSDEEAARQYALPIEAIRGLKTGKAYTSDELWSMYSQI